MHIVMRNYAKLRSVIAKIERFLQMCKLDGAYFEATIDSKKIFAYADSGAARSLCHSEGQLERS